MINSSMAAGTSGRRPSRFVKFASSPKLLEGYKLARNALTGAGTANLLAGASLGPAGIAIGAAAGAGIWLVQRSGILHPAGKRLAKSLHSAGEKLRLSGKIEAISQRMAGEFTDDIGDVTFAFETASAVLKSFVPLANLVNHIAFPVNAAAQVYGLPLDTKNFEDVAKNRNPAIDPQTHKRDLAVETAHILGSFVSTTGSFIPPVDPITTALNVGLQILGFGANRGVDVWNVRRGWKQGYNGSLITRLSRKMLRR